MITVTHLLDLHKLWLVNNPKGVRFSRTALKRYKLSLTGACLTNADLRHADLSYLDLTGVIFAGTNLYQADLQNTNLTGANLSSADLRFTNFTEANLTNARLDNAIVQGINLARANLMDTVLPVDSIVPQTGSLIAWKEVDINVIAKLKIPASAKRVSPIGSRKCRADKVKVLRLYQVKGNKLKRINQQYGAYKVGATITAKLFDDDIRSADGDGIHFYLTQQEALALYPHPTSAHARE